MTNAQGADKADGHKESALLADLDDTCDRFEAAWRAGESPLIESVIEDVAEPLRSLLLRELIALEVAYRRQLGQSPSLAEYQARFPHNSRIVQEGVEGGERSEPCYDLATAERLATPETRSGCLELRCPNCQTPTQLEVDTPLSNLTCRSCGSRFSLVDPVETARLALPISEIGRFELLEQLGVGGFGTVWKARDKQLDRTVAIKIPRQGSMTAEEQERFFQEARAVAQLHHPNIVSIHEVGREGESVYIVSDFVLGVTLDDWLTGQRLTSREAAELCTKIADALHHAHESGVVHRDLKPSNILIDGDMEPHLVDFGLARREVGEATITVDGQILGTPAYMSPEQARGESHQADRRSDIYSLGVILFELLTGERPFRGNARMLVHQVLNDEPPNPRALNRSVPKDLETICLKCLEKEPSKRFGTAREVSQELGRWLRGEPIATRPIGPLSRLLRWSKRRPAVAALGLVILLLAVGGPAVAVRQSQLVRAERAARQQAASEAAKSSAVNDLLLDALESANPDASRGSDYTVRQFLDDISARLEGKFQQQPDTEATIRTTIGNAYRRLYLLDEAKVHLDRAYELRRSLYAPDDPEIATSLYANAWLEYEYGHWDTSEALAKSALKIHEIHGIQNKDTLDILFLLFHLSGHHTDYDLSDRLAKEVRALCEKLPGQEPVLATVLSHSVWTTLRKHGLDRAEAVARESVALNRESHGNSHPSTAWSLTWLGAMLRKQGKLDEAEACCREALTIFRANSDDNDFARNWLSNVLRAKGDLEELHNLRLETLSRADAALADAQMELLPFRVRRAKALLALGRLDDAIAEAALIIAADPELADGWRLRGDCHRLKGEFTKMQEDYQTFIRLARDNQWLPEQLNSIAWNLLTANTEHLRNPESALVLAQEAAELGEEVGTFELPEILDTLALAQHETGANAEAVITLERAVALLPNSSPAKELSYYSRLVLYYHAAGRNDDALTLAEKLADDIVAANSDAPETASNVLAQYANRALSEELGRCAEAFARRCYAMRSELYTDAHEDVWLRYNAESMLGASLALQGKFTKAEPLLVESAEWMTRDPSMPTPEKTGGDTHAQEAIQRVITLYDSWHEAEPGAGHDEQAQQWKKRQSFDPR